VRWSILPEDETRQSKHDSLKSLSARTSRKLTHKHIDSSPPPYTSGMCGTCSVVESDIRKTTSSSADPLCIPDRDREIKTLTVHPK